MRKGILLFCAFVLLLTQGCTRPETLRLGEHPFGKTAFTAEIRGAKGGGEFTAKIGISPTDGDTCVRIEYIAPDTLAGITVEARCQEDGTLSGEAEILRAGTSERLDAENLEGLLSPVSRLLKLAEHTAVQKEGELYTLQFANDITVKVNEAGDLLSYKDSDLQYEVIWLERRETS